MTWRGQFNGSYQIWPPRDINIEQDILGDVYFPVGNGLLRGCELFIKYYYQMQTEVRIMLHKYYCDHSISKHGIYSKTFT